MSTILFCIWMVVMANSVAMTAGKLVHEEDMLQILDKMEKNFEAQNLEIRKNMEATIEDMQKKQTKLEAQNQDYRETRKEDLEIRMNLEARIEELEKNLIHINDDNGELKAMLNNRYKVEDTLFMATISTPTQAISDQEPIIWDSAPINPGGHFNTVIGGYTAPYHGYYQITVTKMSNDYRADSWLLVDNDRYYFNHLNSYGDADPVVSVTINLELQAGQLVRVENHLSSIIYGTNSNGELNSWFTGFMLYAL